MVTYEGLIMFVAMLVDVIGLVIIIMDYSDSRRK